jgi:hypothetical protein
MLAVVCTVCLILTALEPYFVAQAPAEELTLNPTRVKPLRDRISAKVVLDVPVILIKTYR